MLKTTSFTTWVKKLLFKKLKDDEAGNNYNIIKISNNYVKFKKLPNTSMKFEPSYRYFHLPTESKLFIFNISI